MQLSSIEAALRGLQYELNNLDFDALSGAEASRYLELSTPLFNQLEASRLIAAARAVGANQHITDGARSGASWVASRIGISEKSAASVLSTQRRLAELPEVADAALSGCLSIEKASLIGKAADGDKKVARRLLKNASNESVEELQRKVQEEKAKGSTESKRDGLRKSHSSASTKTLIPFLIYIFGFSGKMPLGFVRPFSASEATRHGSGRNIS